MKPSRLERWIKYRHAKRRTAGYNAALLLHVGWTSFRPSFRNKQMIAEYQGGCKPGGLQTRPYHTTPYCRISVGAGLKPALFTDRYPYAFVKPQKTARNQLQQHNYFSMCSPGTSLNAFV